MAYDDLQVIKLCDALEAVTHVLHAERISQREEAMLESLVLACPQISDGGESYILKDDLRNFCKNFIKSLREGDASFLHKEKGYKGRLVDIEEFVESKEYLNQKGSIRPIVKYELQNIINKLDNIREVVLTGCVTGDTVVKVARQRSGAQKSKPITMKDLYNKFNGLKGKWEPKIDTTLLSLKEDGLLAKNTIEAVYYNGVKEVYRVTTSTGKFLKCTMEHRFKVPGNLNEFKPLKELHVGSTIICKSDNRVGRGGKKPNHNRKIIYSVPFHPNARRHMIAGKNYKRIYNYRLVIEAHMNGLSMEEMIYILRNDEKRAKTLKYTSNDDHIHHINRDERDDSLENLMFMTAEEHSKHHGYELARCIGNCEIWEETITSIEYVGKDDVYDIEMKAPYFNYLAQGIVIHNSTGWGKSYLSRILTCYLLYRLSMLHDPQYQYDLAPGSSIVMILQSQSLRLSKKILFNPLLALIAGSPYFIKNFPFNRQVTSELQFPNHIFVSPVSGSEMATLGLDVFAGILSEINYFDVVENSQMLTMRGQDNTTYDQAVNVYTNLIQRLKNRFQDHGKIPGVLILDSAVHYPGDFLDRKVQEAKWDSQIHVVRHAIWDTLSKDRFSGDYFLVEVGNMDRNSRIIEDRAFALPEADIIEVPSEYRTDFDRDIERALRDYVGIATGHRRAFMPFKEAINDAHTVYEALYEGQTLFNEEVIDITNYFDGPFEWEKLINKEYLKQISFNNKADFCMHVDLGISKDRVGLAVGHVQDYKMMPSTSFYSNTSNSFIEMTDMSAPVICIDGMMQITPPPGGEVSVDTLKGFMIYLSTTLNMKIVTMDSFEHVSFVQALRRVKGLRSGTVSTVATAIPYMELKAAYIEGRIIHQSFSAYTDELLFLEYDPKKRKVDHLPHKCFTGDTKVLLADGSSLSFKELAEHFPGNVTFPVWSKDRQGKVIIGTGRNARRTGEKAKVVNVLFYDGYSVMCTPDHLFLTPELTWIRAIDMKDGTLISHVSGSCVTVCKVTSVQVPLDVWDIEVDHYHNFALASGAFVHNSKDISDAVAGVVHMLTHKIAHYRKSNVSNKTEKVPQHRQIAIAKF